MNTDSTHRDTVRARVEAERIARNLSIEALAEGAGIPYATLWRRLKTSQKKATFDVDELAALSMFFGIPLEDLVRDVAA